MQVFEAKRNALFACLDDASKELAGTALDQSGANRTLDLVYRSGSGCRKGTTSSLSPGGILSRMRGKESIFKKPEMPLSKCLKPRKTPDYKINPHKWTKYSLSDVDTSDHTNTSAAFQFLKQMDEQREAEAESNKDKVEVEGGGEIKIEFKKFSKLKRQLREIDDKEVKDVEVDTPKLKGSKLMMPEYVIGQKKDSRKLKQKTIKGAEERKLGTLRLDHLEAEDDEIE